MKHLERCGRRVILRRRPDFGASQARIYAPTVSGKICFKGEPEPLEKEIYEILCSKREDRLSDPFFELVQNTTVTTSNWPWA